MDLFPGFSHDHRDESVEQLKALKPGLKDPDVTVLFQTCCNIARVGWDGLHGGRGWPLSCLWACGGGAFIPLHSKGGLAGFKVG